VLTAIRYTDGHLLRPSAQSLEPSAPPGADTCHNCADGLAVGVAPTPSDDRHRGNVKPTVELGAGPTAEGKPSAR
jgi:hypothetical protein